MRLGALIDGLDAAVGDIDVAGIATDSREVRPGEVFFALPGLRTDGRRHLAEAVARGARAIVAEGPAADAKVPVALVRGVRRVLAAAAARCAGDPSAGLVLVGVTGTNGKTSTTFILESIWRAAGLETGVIGTVGYRGAGRLDRPAPLTTPEAPALQALLAEMRHAGATHVAMEVSSHALAQERVLGCRFDAAVFTNLTRDHLDFHGDVESYYRAKARLFLEHLAASGKREAVAVVNVDDPAGARLAGEVRTRCVRVGAGETADVRPLDIETTLAGTRGVLSFGGTPLPFCTRLVGAPQVENLLGAAATAWALGIAPAAVAAGLAAVTAPPGRLERFDGPGFTVMVDYAHTPDALARALTVLRPLTPGRMIAVFGCGGDRDPGKRPLMGEAAARLSDVVVLTSDNPRTEDPGRILDAVEAGVVQAGLGPLGEDGRGYLVQADRRAAIALAIRLARPGDLVLVAGKGHEDYQIVGHEKHHLDDREEVRRALGSGDAERLEEGR